MGPVAASRAMGREGVGPNTPLPGQRQCRGEDARGSRILGQSWIEQAEAAGASAARHSSASAGRSRVCRTGGNVFHRSRSGGTDFEHQPVAEIIAKPACSPPVERAIRRRHVPCRCADVNSPSAELPLCRTLRSLACTREQLATRQKQVPLRFFKQAAALDHRSVNAPLAWPGFGFDQLISQSGTVQRTEAPHARAWHGSPGPPVPSRTARLRSGLETATPPPQHFPTYGLHLRAVCQIGDEPA